VWLSQIQWEHFLLSIYQLIGVNPVVVFQVVLYAHTTSTNLFSQYFLCKSDCLGENVFQFSIGHFYLSIFLRVVGSIFLWCILFNYMRFSMRFEVN
jgi:hypothetical protein